MKTMGWIGICALTIALFPAIISQGDSPRSVFPGDEWDTMTPEEAGLDEAVLERLAELVGGRGCVVRHGHMVYSWGEQEGSADVASAFKPVLSTLLFFAVQDGLITSPDDRVSEHEPRLLELDPDKDGQITWTHLGSQTSGYGLAEGPGEAYAYNDYALALYYDALMDKVFEPHADEVLARYLGDPLGFEDAYTFEAFGPHDRPGRLALSVRDFARFGQFILHQGRWGEEQLLAPEYVEEMITTVLPADTPIASGEEAPMLENQRTVGGGRTGTDVGPGFYSFNWWVNGVDRDGNRLYQDGPTDLLLAGGHGGRRNLWIIPSLDLIISWNDSRITDHDDSPTNPDTLSNQAVRLMMEAVINSEPEPANPNRHTTVTIDGDRWRINGEITYPGAPAEGLLMNVRMVSATFEDRNRDDFDADANTDAFLAALPEYVDYGVRAFTFCLQGGFPGYEDALNSAFNPDGSLRPDYMARIERVLDACDEHGVVAILGLFYQRQDGLFENADALRNGVRNAMVWLTEKGYRNVVVEITNEYGHHGFDQDMLRQPEGQVELIELARSVAPDIYVSTSGGGGGTLHDEVAEASDFMLIHFNHTALEDIPDRIERLRHLGRPIVCNEDDKIGEEGAEAARITVEHGASWGLMAFDVNQAYPFVFDGAADDPPVYEALKELTTAPGDHDSNPVETEEPVAASTPFERGSIQGKTPRITIADRHFETVDGQPFFPIADTAWLLTRLSNEDIEYYISARSDQGFNIIKFGPESDPVDFEQLNAILDLLDKYNMYAELYIPAYDYNADVLIESNYDYAHAIAESVKERSNIFAYTLEGFDSPYGKGNVEGMRTRLAEAHRGLKTADPTRLITHHPRSGHSVVDHSGVDPASMDFYSVHRCNPGSIQGLLDAELNRTPVKPVFLTEPVYEGQGNMCGCQHGCTADHVFQQIDEAVESGAAGISYGHYSIWSFNLGTDGTWGPDPSPEGTPWRDALHLSAGAERMVQLIQRMPAWD